ncbi:MAG TPA: hypothetical protein VI583_09040, partial [Cyclobacteriaceae bacterium]|nr:hypothetical protein [Cyclobacteriaceae bacterium]
FGQSLMYGAGYDFAPHFAYCLKDIVGSLPVGMDCMSGDDPHWSATNNATYKEIWVEPVNRFLGTVAVYSSYSPPAGSDINYAVEIIETVKKGKTIQVTISGTGKHTLDIKTFNLKAGNTSREVDLSTPDGGTIRIDATLTDPASPYILLLTVDGKPEWRKEITGALVETNLN